MISNHPQIDSEKINHLENSKAITDGLKANHKTSGAVNTRGKWKTVISSMAFYLHHHATLFFGHWQRKTVRGTVQSPGVMLGSKNEKATTTLTKDAPREGKTCTLLSPESSGLAASHHALRTVIPLSLSISLSHALSQDWELLESRDLIFHNCFHCIQKSASPAMDTQ